MTKVSNSESGGMHPPCRPDLPLRYTNKRKSQHKSEGNRQHMNEIQIGWGPRWQSGDTLTSENGVWFLARPQVEKFVVACREFYIHTDCMSLEN